MAAACQLGRAGIAVQVIEARDRVGGRVFTHSDQSCDCPIELGAEFIHGKPPEILDGTVHGAIASGCRAAKQILNATN